MLQVTFDTCSPEMAEHLLFKVVRGSFHCFTIKSDIFYLYGDHPYKYEYKIYPRFLIALLYAIIASTGKIGRQT